MSEWIPQRYEKERKAAMVANAKIVAVLILIATAYSCAMSPAPAGKINMDNLRGAARHAALARGE